VTPVAASPRTGKKLPFLQPGLLIGSLLPLALLASRALRGTLGADPIAIGMNQLGLLALIFLLASLAATPLKVVFGVTWPIRIRRSLGLLSFFHATLHFLLYFVIDQGLALSAVVQDVTKRTFITVGFCAFVLLIPLAVTSTSRMLKRMGAARWKRLHRLSYVAAILGVVHFVWRVKKDLSQPTLYACVLGLLFAIRLWQARNKKALARGF